MSHSDFLNCCKIQARRLGLNKTEIKGNISCIVDEGTNNYQINLPILTIILFFFEKPKYDCIYSIY